MIDETETRIQTPTDIPTDTPMVTVTATAAEKVRELLDAEGNPEEVWTAPVRRGRRLLGYAIWHDTR